MLVDPNTGMPMDGGPQRENMIEAALSADSASAGMASGFAQGMGVSRKGDILDKTLDTIPGLTQTTAWNVRRGFNTIAYGGRGVNQIGGFRATMSPRFLTRLPSMEALGGPSAKTSNYIFSAKKYGAGESYTPFNILARGGNYAMGKSAGRVTSSIAKNATASGKTVAEIQSDMMKTKMGRFKLGLQSLGGEEGGAFSMGALARITAADKMARGKLPTGNVLNFLGKTDAKLAGEFKQIKLASTVQKNVQAARAAFQGYVPGAQHLNVANAFSPTNLNGPTIRGIHSSPIGLGAGVTASAEESAMLSYASVTGSVSGRVSGFMAHMRMGTVGMDAVKAADAAGNKAFMSGFGGAMRFMEKTGIERIGATATAKGTFQAVAGGALEKFGVQAGERVGLSTALKVGIQKGGAKLGARIAAASAVNVVPIAGQIVSALLWADLAMDVGKLGVEVFKSGVDFAKEGVKSYRGQINKGVMGMGYRDNTVAATSRARGVQAIQNSRLNARSVLGSEAGAMHAHFG